MTFSVLGVDYLQALALTPWIQQATAEGFAVMLAPKEQEQIEILTWLAVVNRVE